MLTFDSVLDDIEIFLHTPLQKLITTNGAIHECTLATRVNESPARSNIHNVMSTNNHQLSEKT